MIGYLGGSESKRSNAEWANIERRQKEEEDAIKRAKWESVIQRRRLDKYTVQMVLLSFIHRGYIFTKLPFNQSFPEHNSKGSLRIKQLTYAAGILQYLPRDLQLLIVSMTFQIKSELLTSRFEKFTKYRDKKPLQPEFWDKPFVDLFNSGACNWLGRNIQSDQRLFRDSDENNPLIIEQNNEVLKLIENLDRRFSFTSLLLSLYFDSNHEANVERQEIYDLIARDTEIQKTIQAIGLLKDMPVNYGNLGKFYWTEAYLENINALIYNKFIAICKERHLDPASENMQNLLNSMLSRKPMSLMKVSSGESSLTIDEVHSTNQYLPSAAAAATASPEGPKDDKLRTELTVKNGGITP